MKNKIFTVLLLLFLSACQKKMPGNEKAVSYQPVEKVLTQSQLDSIEHEKYYGYDTLLLEQYTSDNGHRIELRGSASQSLYSLVATSNKGIKQKFELTDNSYVASHSSILWDNDDFIFVRYGCGLPCWGGQLLTINEERPIKYFDMFLYEDSIHNLVLFTDTLDQDILILEDFSTGKKDTQKFDFCEKLTFSFYAIDSVIYVEPKSVKVQYKSKDCEVTKSKILKIEN